MYLTLEDLVDIKVEIVTVSVTETVDCETEELMQHYYAGHWRNLLPEAVEHHSC
jgi:hypothetical protein